MYMASQRLRTSCFKFFVGAEMLWWGWRLLYDPYRLACQKTPGTLIMLTKLGLSCETKDAIFCGALYASWLPLTRHSSRLWLRIHHTHMYRRIITLWSGHKALLDAKDLLGHAGPGPEAWAWPPGPPSMKSPPSIYIYTLYIYIYIHTRR